MIHLIRGGDLTRQGLNIDTGACRVVLRIGSWTLRVRYSRALRRIFVGAGR